MNRKSLLTLALVIFTIASASAIAADTVRVSKVTGVDVFQTDDGRTFGLLGITSPNGKQATVAECTAQLKTLIEGREVVIVADTTVEDAEGKTPQRLVYLNGVLINLKMISDGYARPSSTQHQMASSFASAHSTARSSGVGTFRPRPTTTTPEPSSSRSERSTAVQCSGTTQSGRRCKRKTTDASGRCWQH